MIAEILAALARSNLAMGAAILVVLALRGQTIAENLAGRDPVSGAGYVLSLLAFALWPWWFGRRAGARA